MIFHNAISTFLGSFIPSTRPIRFTRRIQWVSVTIAGFPNTSPMTRLALFLPTPGRLRIDLKSVGILPLYSSLKTFIHLLISLALLFPRPQGRTISSISATSAAASASTVGYFSNNPFTSINTGVILGLKNLFNESREMIERATKTYSYDEAFDIINEYVEIVEEKEDEEDEEFE